MINILLALLWFDLVTNSFDMKFSSLIAKTISLILMSVISYFIQKHISNKLRKTRLRLLDGVETKAIFSIIGEKGILENKDENIEDLMSEVESEIDLRIIKRILMLLYLDN